MKTFILDDYPQFHTIAKQRYRENFQRYSDTFKEYGYHSAKYERTSSYSWVWSLDDAEFTWFILQWG